MDVQFAAVSAVSLGRHNTEYMVDMRALNWLQTSNCLVLLMFGSFLYHFLVCQQHGSCFGSTIIQAVEAVILPCVVQWRLQPLLTPSLG